MISYQFEDWKRINKTKARKLFNEGKEVVATPVKMRFGTVWNSGLLLEKRRYGETFDQIVALFEYFNCSNETGRYSAFYTREELQQ